MLRNNGETGANQPALKLGPGVDGFVGSGIFCLDTAGTTMSYGVEIGDGAQNIQLYGAVKGAVTGKVNDLTTSPPAPGFTDGMVNW